MRYRIGRKDKMEWFLLYWRVYPDPITSSDSRLGMQDFIHWIVLFQTVGDQSTEQLNSILNHKKLLHHFFNHFDNTSELRHPHSKGLLFRTIGLISKTLILQYITTLNWSNETLKNSLKSCSIQSQNYKFKLRVHKFDITR